MVFGNIRDLKDYGYLEEDVLKCFEYAKIMICWHMKQEVMK